MIGRSDDRRRRRSPESGAVVIAVGLVIMALVGLTALGIDVGQIAMQKTWLQATADAAALAGVHALPDGDPRPDAQRMVAANYPDGGTVVAAADIQSGRWSGQDERFTAGAVPPNAVRVIARRAAANDNPVPTIVMGALGFPVADVTAVAIATREEDPQMCFLIDDEMIDTDIPVIESLASALGKSPDDLLSDRNNDRFIDIPGGTQLSLPTGQVGDEALFQPNPAVFPFTPKSTPYTLQDFLRHQDGAGPIPDGLLDPLVGTRAIRNPSEYPNFVNPERVCVAPIYKSDVSRLGPPQNERVNAKGERRGLLAFSIVAVGADPPGSVLPNVVIRVIDPSEVEVTEVVINSPLGGPRLVSAVP